MSFKRLTNDFPDFLRKMYLLSDFREATKISTFFAKRAQLVRYHHQLVSLQVELVKVSSSIITGNVDYSRPQDFRQIPIINGSVSILTCVCCAVIMDACLVVIPEQSQGASVLAFPRILLQNPVRGYAPKLTGGRPQLKVVLSTPHTSIVHTQLN